MKEAVPNYYHKFQCIADRCKHNCCIGWEIDIDEETMQLYQALDSDMGEKIRNNIEGEVPHFVLGENDRCPFLNEKGLCDIICACGEDALCDICYLHPRFRNFYSSFVETGLGLCCEAAAGIILSETEPFLIKLPENIKLLKEEKEFFKKRNEIFGILQNREKSIGSRFYDLSRGFGFDFRFSLEALCRIYRDLERLDEEWTSELDSLSGFSFDDSIFEEEAFQKVFEQLAVYFIFRHLGGAMQDGNYFVRVKFAVVSCYIIGALWAHHLSVYGSISTEKMIDFARMYSQEVEYSEENTAFLFDKGLV